MNETPGVEAPSPVVVAVAKWAGMSPVDANGIAISIFAVLIGIVTRRVLAAGRGQPRPKWHAEVCLIPVEVIIALVAIRGTGASGIAAIILAVVVGHAGGPLVEQFLTRREAAFSAPEKASAALGVQASTDRVVLPPAAPNPAIEAVTSQLETDR